MPKINRDYWEPKLVRNKERDKINKKKLHDLGWDVMTVWECEVKADKDLAARISAFLDG